jgi:hypothetical protein
MKIDWELIVAFLIAMVAFKLISKLFLDAVVEKIGTFEILN